MPLLPGICHSFPLCKARIPSPLGSPPDYPLSSSGAHSWSSLNTLWIFYLVCCFIVIHLLSISPTRLWAPSGWRRPVTHPAFACGMSYSFCVCFETQPCCYIYSLETNKHLSNTKLCEQCIQHEGNRNNGTDKGNLIRLARV